MTGDARRPGAQFIPAGRVMAFNAGLHRWKKHIGCALAAERHGVTLDATLAAMRIVVELGMGEPTPRR